MPGAVTVVGSANLDVVLRVGAVPPAGSTVLARSRAVHPGGKGLNQAVAAARAGAHTAVVAAVGQDEAGETLLATLREAGIGTAALRRLPVPTGTAYVVVGDSGDNAIVVDAGANAALTALDPAAREAVEAADVLLAQLEVPLALVAEAAALARGAGATVVLNASPVPPPGPELDALVDLLALVDVLVVNEHEAVTLAGASDPSRAAAALAAAGREVVVTLGAAGARHVGPDGRTCHEPGLPARVRDTTGAGDAFAGVLAACRADGAPVDVALRRAVAAGALTVERDGAVPSLPTATEVDARLAQERVAS